MCVFPICSDKGQTLKKIGPTNSWWWPNLHSQLSGLNQTICFLCLLAFDRETNESNLLLKEKADNLQGKLQRAEQRVTELMRVEIENEVCKWVFS